ncbi:MAG TPA: T9SS type A sorting domain-containing protein [Ferruginibacter sp.]|nr:T9SS type A sorting domain-containing protein [Ferruginibacter sp.]
MVDRDGRFAYSPIRTVRFDKAGSLNIYPNPAKEGFTISFSSSWQGKSLVLELFDVAGKRVYREEWKQGPATVYVPTNNLQVGHYILKVQGADQNILSQLIQVIK